MHCGLPLGWETSPLRFAAVEMTVEAGSADVIRFLSE